MKSFRRSQNPSPAVQHASRAAKRNYLRHRLAWQPIEDADRAHAADLRHGVPGTLALPPSMRGTIGPGRGFRHVLGGGK